MNQKVLFLILCIIFPLFISCSDMLSDYTGQGGGPPPSTGDVRITNAAGLSHWPILTWTGTEYGVAWGDCRDDISNYEIYFTRINSAGIKQGKDIRITNTASCSDHPSLVWTGTQYGMAWDDSRDGHYNIYFARINSLGEKQGPDVQITNTTTSSEFPSLVWTGKEYGVAWQDSRDGNAEIYFVRINSTGTKQGPEVRITNASDSSYWPSLVWTGTEYGVAWRDDRDGNFDIYFTRISANGIKVGSDVRITRASVSDWPSLVWTGTEYGVAWQNYRDGNYEIYFARLYPDGTKK